MPVLSQSVRQSWPHAVPRHPLPVGKSNWGGAVADGNRISGFQAAPSDSGDFAARARLDNGFPTTVRWLTGIHCSRQTTAVLCDRPAGRIASDVGGLRRRIPYSASAVRYRYGRSPATAGLMKVNIVDTIVRGRFVSLRCRPWVVFYHGVPFNHSGGSFFSTVRSDSSRG